MPASARVTAGLAGAFREGGRSFRAVLGAAVASVSCAAAMADRAPIETPDGVRFTFANAAATSVSVAGNFNEWSATANPLARSGKVWTAVVTLPPGEHLFMYIVDGKWMVPPLAEEYADDGFGSRNGVVIVRPRER
jgi:1,4-alpha-glucan branching enzyme